MSRTSTPVVPCSCAEGWKPEGWLYCVDCYEGKIDRLEKQLAEADGLIATHANSIDSSHPSAWPKGSLLAAAVERHGMRCAQPPAHRGDARE